MAKKKKNTREASLERSDDGRWVVCKEYTNRWGQKMVAADYGYQFWRFLAK